jgi:hypothetical protein
MVEEAVIHFTLGVQKKLLAKRTAVLFGRRGKEIKWCSKIPNFNPLY